MPSDLFVEFGKRSRVVALTILVDLLLLLLQGWRKIRWEVKIRVTALPDPLSRAKKEHSILYQRAANCGAVVPPQQKRHLRARHVRGIQKIIAVEERDSAVPCIGPTLGQDVQDST